MKILFVSNGYPPSAYGGVEVYVYQLANLFAQRGHQVAVFCRESSESRPDHETIEEEINGVRIFWVVNDFKNARTFEDTFRDSQIEDYFKSILERVSPQVIHFNHLITLSFSLPLIAQEMKIPSLISLHDYWPFCFQVRLVDWKGRQCGGPLQGGDCYRCIQGGNGGIVNKAMGLAKRMIPWEVRQQLRQRLVRQSASSYLAELSVEVIDRRYQSYQNAILSALRILTPSQFIKKQYIANGYPGDRIEVVPLGVEIPSTRLNLENRSRGEGLHFTFVGTLIPSKGLDVLIRAFKRLESQNVSLAVYGREDVAPFEYRSQLKELSQGDDRIRFLGPFSQEQRVQVYEKTDIVVIPSRFPETFSLVAHEALAFGKPVIASSIGALPEVVKDGVNGYLVDPGDEDALHALLERIVMNPTTLDRMDCPGPVRIYSINEHGDRIEEMYQEILNSNA